MDSRLLTIDEVTAACIAVIKNSDTNRDRLLFRSWIAEAMNQIGPNVSWLKSCSLFPDSGSFKKPKDLVSVCDLALYDSTSNEVKYNFIANSPGRIHVNRFEIFDNSNNLGVTGRVDLSEDGYYFHLGTNGRLVSRMDISYLAMPVDRDGMPLVPETNLTAYKIFCRWNWSMRENNNQSAIDQNYSMWLREMNKARGRNKMPSEFRAKEFFKKYLSLVSTPIFDN